ncbi:hypothetical protein HY004_01050 [Candidatus Saccharibacteria bacterium]|nr:hypothetical protein [Candidatus Saccharibacteria bacterium]
MPTLPRLIRRNRVEVTDLDVENGGIEAEKAFIAAEFDLLHAKALEDGLGITEVYLKKDEDSSRHMVQELNSVPFNAAGLVEIVEPITNEGPVDVRRMLVVKRQDPDTPRDIITTFFQLDIVRQGGKEDLRSAVLFSEVIGEDIAKEATVRFNAQTGEFSGNQTIKRHGEKKEHIDTSLRDCNHDIHDAVATLDQPVVEVVESVTDEFEAIQDEDEGIVADFNISDTSSERRGVLTSTKVAIKLGAQAAKDAFMAARQQETKR